MDISRMGRGGLNNLPEYIIENFVPGARPLLQKYPRLFKVLGLILAIWYFIPLSRVQSLWNQFSSTLTATVTVNSEEDLFGYLISYLAERRTLRYENSLNAISNPPQDDRRRRRHDPDYEETARKPHEETKIKYEQAQGMHVFVHKKRLFYVSRAYGEGHSYFGNRYKRTEVLSISCLGRSTQPIKDLIEDIYSMNKDKERTMTVIRRPFTGGYSSRLSWSRLTSKPRRALDTVILDAKQKEAVIKDVEEYMDENTQAFYGNHGIPYRRGYLFHGPPGCGKTSFCLALASKFNLDVYVLTLLDHELQDSDLMSLLNQLPSPSLLLLEDIDTAGLSRKKPYTTTSASSGGGGGGKKKRKGGAGGMPEGAISKVSEKAAGAGGDPGLESDDDASGSATRVSLSGLLNAIDGVAAPEGHILIMTTNKPHELDDALVRAGRISYRVEFTNATKTQAEEIFLRMYVDLPQIQTKPAVTTSPAQDKDPLNIQSLASAFAARIPEGDFSPADLQDYLIVHKKDPAGAVSGLEAWIEQQYEDRKRREDEKDAEMRYKVQKADDRRRKWREDMRVALKGEVEAEADDESEANVEDEVDEKAEKDKNVTEDGGKSEPKATEGESKEAKVEA